MKNARTKRQQRVLDLFPEKTNLSAEQVLTMLRKDKETEIETSLPYDVRYILSYLELRGDLVLYPYTANYRRA